MRGDHFYLTLPSNTSDQHYGVQIPNDYRTKLDHSITLDPDLWEVGLAELTYSKSWHNVPPVPFYVEHPSAPDDSHDIEMYTHGMFGGDTYRSGKQLIRDLHAKIRDVVPGHVEQGVRLRYDELSHKLKFVLKQHHYVWVYWPLGQVLGLSTSMAGQLIGPGQELGYIVPGPMGLDSEAPSIHRESSYSVDVDRLVPTLYVYCDLVEQQHVGGDYVQLLRAVDVPPWSELGDGDVVRQEFKHVHYSGLQTGTFESVHIKLADPRGKPILFKHGNVTVKLHFRQKKR